MYEKWKKWIMNLENKFWIRENRFSSGEN